MWITSSTKVTNMRSTQRNNEIFKTGSTHSYKHYKTVWSLNKINTDPTSNFASVYVQYMIMSGHSGLENVMGHIFLSKPDPSPSMWWLYMNRTWQTYFSVLHIQTWPKLGTVEFVLCLSSVAFMRPSCLTLRKTYGLKRQSQETDWFLHFCLSPTCHGLILFS